MNLISSKNIQTARESSFHANPLFLQLLCSYRSQSGIELNPDPFLSSEKAFSWLA